MLECVWAACVLRIVDDVVVQGVCCRRQLRKEGETRK